MIKKISLLTLSLFLFSIIGYSQTTYSTYEGALENFKKYSKTKGFDAVEDKYDHCKNLKKASLRNMDDKYNPFTENMEVTVTWDYKYVGCYVGWDKYTGSAKVKGYIVKTSNGRYKYGYKGTSVLHWDPDN